jgi:hypothetical protein
MPELQVGREMDAAVARAIGLRFSMSGEFVKVAGRWLHLDTGERGWSPSHSDAHAFAALDELRARYPGYGFELWTANDGWAARWDHLSGFFAANTRTEAVCRAILALKGAT